MSNSVEEPNGGFLPIYECDTIEKISEEEPKREYRTHTKAISIKTLMEKRREKNPFVK